MKEKSSSHQDLTCAIALKDRHIQKYTGARVEVGRLTQISIQEPKRLLDVSFDGMDNNKVNKQVSSSNKRPQMAMTAIKAVQVLNLTSKSCLDMSS